MVHTLTKAIMGIYLYTQNIITIYCIKMSLSYNRSNIIEYNNVQIKYNIASLHSLSSGFTHD